MKYNKVTISLDLGEWVIKNDGSVYFFNEETDAYWESSISIFRDYEDKILYEDFVIEIKDDMDIVPGFEKFKELIADSFKVFEL